jgi:hypothetical protein
MTYFARWRRRFIHYCIQTLWRWEREVLQDLKPRSSFPQPWTLGFGNWSTLRKGNTIYYNVPPSSKDRWTPFRPDDNAN